MRTMAILPVNAVCGRGGQLAKHVLGTMGQRTPRPFRLACIQCVDLTKILTRKMANVIPMPIRSLVSRSVEMLRTRYRLALLMICLLFVCYLHVKVIPRATSGYNDPCYLSQHDMADMKFLLIKVTDGLNKLNVTYWLDFGTLLGVWKTGEILSYDHDIDIGRMLYDLNNDTMMYSKLGQMLRPFNITVNEFQAKYKKKTVDLLRWKIRDKKDGGTGKGRILYKWYPFTENFGTVGNIFYYFMSTDTVYDLVLPIRDISVYGHTMKIPNKPLSVIKERYPWTWFISFPYKWKCWFQSARPD